ncbi:MAG: hypothetical protein A3G18_03925 [Rhodospirillales bacterium RIFCSPLOWO2_12_FULL_58_28]|nr:MAG: hypothetical protein A3H92_04805 [Rhodospirillales bacterium RIFCSPLOWO2_02_FULL_58_16]OHC78676.1 MAG: hypothetical protein A3G18_03925 [Rhodospirillales bacterium RIFCSPLOWO2_12_FULL_58_28]
MIARISGAALTVAAIIAVLSGCAAPPSTVIEPEGKLEVLDVVQGFSPGDLPGSWVVEGAGNVVKTQLAVVEKDGVKALKITNSPAGFIVARRTKAMLLATPFLTWAWNMAPHGSGFHPVRVVVGFSGDAQKSGSWGKSASLPGSALPPHDRALAFTWGDTALQRGTLIKPTAKENVAPLYTVRGGRENAGSWWLEAVDLSELYARVWPGEEQGGVQVVFIGVASAGGHEPSAAHVSEIKLSR